MVFWVLLPRRAHPDLHELQPHQGNVSAIGQNEEECLCMCYPLWNQQQQLHFWRLVHLSQELAFPLRPDWLVDYEYYTWQKLDPGSDETLVWEYFSWEGAFQHVGKAINQGKIFKWTWLASRLAACTYPSRGLGVIKGNWTLKIKMFSFGLYAMYLIGKVPRDFIYQSL